MDFAELMSNNKLVAKLAEEQLAGIRQIEAEQAALRRLIEEPIEQQRRTDALIRKSFRPALMTPDEAIQSFGLALRTQDEIILGAAQARSTSAPRRGSYPARDAPPQHLKDFKPDVPLQDVIKQEIKDGETRRRKRSKISRDEALERAVGWGLTWLKLRRQGHFLASPLEIGHPQLHQTSGMRPKSTDNFLTRHGILIPEIRAEIVLRDGI